MVRRTGSTRIPFIGVRSMTMPPSTSALPATLWPPPRTATRMRCVRAKSTASIDVGNSGTLNDQCRVFVDERVVVPSGHIVVRIARTQYPATQTTFKFLDDQVVQVRCFNQLHDVVPFPPWRLLLLVDSRPCAPHRSPFRPGHRLRPASWLEAPQASNGQ